MDLLLWGHANGVRRLTSRVGSASSPADVETAFQEIERKRVATEYLHAPPCSSIRPTERVRDRRHRAAPGRATGRRGGAAADGAAIRHRGPDGFGLALDRGGRARLDPARDRRPAMRMAAARRRPTAGDLLVYNGEVYNHLELREGSRPRRDVRDHQRHRGRSAAARAGGPRRARPVQRPVRVRVVAARATPAHAGARPVRRPPASLRLLDDGTPRVRVGGQGPVRLRRGERPAPISRASTRYSRSGARGPADRLRGVDQLPPGGLLVWERGRIIEQRRWWAPEYGVGGRRDGDLRELLRRQRAAAPSRGRAVGAYLSGGLDSSLISALAQIEKGGELAPSRSPSRIRATTSGPIRRRSPGRSAPATTWSRPARRDRPGAPGGASPYRDAAGADRAGAALPARRAGPRQRPHGGDHRRGRRRALLGLRPVQGGRASGSCNRTEPERAQALLEEFYPYLGGGGARRGPAFTRFLLETGSPDDPLGSHLTRADGDRHREGVLPARGRRRGRRDRLAGAGFATSCRPAFDGWSTLERAAWLEVSTLLEPYLLAAQGDRVAMAHGVEGRFPFLDHRVFAYSVELPTSESSTACATRSPCATSPPTCSPRR